ncbi:Sodium-dependent phosphate transporter 1-A [Toxocara canis]|uniref:Phosphate transporter n=1 Tax=Toxocara canis TaxID=6265 RepID=A0A0B2UQB3_TOXCA|nr:Sodium-dependent phosphate transporter 1-A [Toxocara canis]
MQTNGNDLAPGGHNGKMTFTDNIVYSPEWMGHYEWAIVTGFILAFWVSYGMGANDACNDWGTSVGAGTVKLWQAYILCAIFNTFGAILLGYKVTETIRSGIVDVSVYNVYSEYNHSIHTYQRVAHCDPIVITTLATGVEQRDDVDCARYTAVEFLFGQLGTLAGVAVFMIISSVFKIPVSATHAIVGATLAFTLYLRGNKGVKWAEIVGIITSWFISPIIAGVVASCIYLAIKFTVLLKKDSFNAALNMCPLFMWFTLAVNIFACIFDGSKYLGFDKLNWWEAGLLSFMVGAVVAGITHFFLRGWVSQRAISLHERDLVKKEKRQAKRCDNVVDQPYSTSVEMNGLDTNNTKEVTIPQLHWYKYLYTAIPEEPRTSKHQKGKTSSEATKEKCETSTAHHNAEPYKAYQTKIFINLNSSHVEMNGLDTNNTKEVTIPQLHWYKYLYTAIPEEPRTSKVFNALQMISASLLSFSHGANDTANTVAPLVAIWLTYKTGYALTQAEERNDMQMLLAFGAVAMIVGFVTLGHRTITLIAKEITVDVSAPSGFAVELGTAFMVLICAKVGIPVSSTHCAVGAVLFVGITKSTVEGISWIVLRKIVLVWLLCFPVSGLISFLITLTLTKTFQ